MRKEQKIVVLDDEDNVLHIVKKMLETKFPYCSVYTFNKVDSNLYKFLTNNEISLYIIDIKLQGNSGTDFALEVIKHRDSAIFLFISGYNYDLSSFDEFKGKAIYDFMSKPVAYDELVSRVSVLLNIALTYNNLEKRVQTIRNVVWDMMNYANLFIVVLDKEMNVKIANWYLATTLGFKSEDQIVGKNWLEFVPENIHKKLREYHKYISTGNNIDQKTREFVNDIITANGEIICVKWFNTQVNGNYNWTFSIGIPFKQFDFDETEESIRAYYRDVVDQDKSMIEALRDTILDLKETPSIDLPIPDCKLGAK